MRTEFCSLTLHSDGTQPRGWFYAGAFHSRRAVNRARREIPEPTKCEIAKPARYTFANSLKDDDDGRRIPLNNDGPMKNSTLAAASSRLVRGFERLGSEVRLQPAGR